MSKKAPAQRQRRSAAPRKTRAIMRGFSYYNTAGGGTRTHTPSRTTDFESVSSANSDTPAYCVTMCHDLTCQL